MTAPSTQPDLPGHGGDLDHATRLYGEPPGGWLDLSTGINPHPYPVPPLGSAALARLPGAADLARLIDIARRAYGAPDAAALIAVPGSELALRLLPAILPEGPVAVLAPGYASHADAFAQLGRPIVKVASPGDLAPDTGILMLGNPNNPDGRRFEPGELAGLAADLDARGGVLIVDEAFADVVPTVSLLPYLRNGRAIVLRSFGKFFGLPGLRLGFVAGPPEPIERLERRLGAWPVNNAAIAIGTAALSDRSWEEAMRLRLASEAEQMRALLVMHGLDVAGGTDLFLYIRHPQAHALHRGLAGNGVWTRIFADDAEHLRIGLAPPGPALARLDAALGAALRAL